MHQQDMLKLMHAWQQYSRRYKPVSHLLTWKGIVVPKDIEEARRLVLHAI